MCGGYGYWCDVSVKQKCFFVMQKDVVVVDIGFFCVQGFNFLVLQGKFCFEFFFDKVFVMGVFVKCDGR